MLKILTASLLVAASAFAAGGITPLNIQTGLWQVTMTSTVDNMPKPRTRTYSSCVRKQDLGNYPFSEHDANCSWTVLRSTGSKMDVTGTCTPKGMGQVEFKISLEAENSENVKGTGHLLINGPSGAMNGSYAGSAKWIGAACPAT